MSPINATWHLITQSDALKRSSQTLFTTGDDLIVFSGELEPRKPVDKKIYHVPLNTSNPGTKGQVTMMNPSGAPSPRVGAASAQLGGRACLFSGRGGEAWHPLRRKVCYGVLTSGRCGGRRPSRRILMWSIRWGRFIMPWLPIAKIPCTSTLAVPLLAVWRISGHSPSATGGRRS